MVGVRQGAHADCRLQGLVRARQAQAPCGAAAQVWEFPTRRGKGDILELCAGGQKTGLGEPTGGRE